MVRNSRRSHVATCLLIDYFLNEYLWTPPKQKGSWYFIKHETKKIELHYVVLQVAPLSRLSLSVLFVWYILYLCDIFTYCIWICARHEYAAAGVQNGRSFCLIYFQPFPIKDEWNHWAWFFYLAFLACSFHTEKITANLCQPFSPLHNSSLVFVGKILHLFPTFNLGIFIPSKFFNY